MGNGGHVFLSSSMRKCLLLLLLPVVALAIYDSEVFEVNNWRLRFYNDSRIGIDPYIGRDSTGEQRNGHPYIFGAGPWFGCIVDDDTIVTSGYDPNSAAGAEMFPTLTRYRAEGHDNSADRFYTWWRDWPPPVDRFPMAPQEVVSQMDMWCCYSDSNPYQTLWPEPPPGIDFVQTVYGYDYPLAKDIIFVHYEVFNAGESNLESCYFGFCADVDIGEHTDDGVALLLDREFAVGQDTFTVRNAAYAFDWDNMEWPSDTWTPGTVCLKLLYPYGTLSAFKKFSIDFDPPGDPQQYLAMAGYDYRTGIYAPFDSVDCAPADKRFLLATGPFCLEPDSLAEFWFAIIGSPYGTWGQRPEERDLSDLALRCYWADGIFEQVFASLIGEHRPVPKDKPLLCPNPFSEFTAVNLNLAQASNVDIKVTDVTGRTVRILQDGLLQPGRHAIPWDGTDDNGARLSRGVYFVKVRTPGQSFDVKTVLAR